MKNRIIVFVIALSIFISPNTHGMLAEAPSVGESDIMILEREPNLLISILFIAGATTFFTIPCVSRYFHALWHSPLWQSYGLCIFRPEIESSELGFVTNTPVINGENIYLAAMGGSTASGSCLKIAKRKKRDIPIAVTKVEWPCSPTKNGLVFVDPFIIVPIDLATGTAVVRLNERNEYRITDFGLTARVKPTVRGTHLYVISHRELREFLCVCHINNQNKMQTLEKIEMSFIPEVVFVLDERDILVEGCQGQLSIVRKYQDENQVEHHRIVQDLELGDHIAHFLPAVDGAFVYLSYQGSPLRLIPNNFYIIRRDMDGNYAQSETFQVGEYPPAAVIIGRTVIVGGSHSVSIFQRDNKGYHHLVQTLDLGTDHQCPTLRASGNMLFASYLLHEIIHAYYRGPDGVYRFIRTFSLPGENCDIFEPREPLLDGDTLYIRGRGTQLATFCFAAPQIEKGEDDSEKF